MLSIDETSSKLYEYLLEIVELSPDELMTIKVALKYIREIAPTDRPLIFTRLENMVSASEDLSWVIMVVNRKLSEIKAKINNIKSPAFTTLVRQGRPSTQAIEYEILFANPELKDLEMHKSTLVNIIEYLNHIEKSIDRYIFVLRDKLKSD